MRQKHPTGQKRRAGRAGPPCRRRGPRVTRRALLLGAGAAALGAAGLWLRRLGGSGGEAPAAPDAGTPPAGEWRAAWISYIELQGMDYTSAEAFRAGAAAMMDRCAGLGLNTVIVQVRPFGDALYPSALFPWSHICTGVQGVSPGFDPLDILLTEAHSRGLSFEGWINPYRLQASASSPGTLAADNLANTHPDWVAAAGGGLYLNPAIPEAAAYVVEGVAELVRTYPVDGVHFDDYFYPTTDPAIDAARFAASGAADLAEWRRQNVTALVKAAQDEGFSLEHESGAYDYGLTFSEEAAEQCTESAEYVNIRFNGYKSTTFEYDAASGRYLAWQYGEEYIDSDTGEQMGFTNLLVLNTSMSVLDSVGRLAVRTTGEGEGYFACGGKYVPIVWSREDNTSPFKYSLADGTPLNWGVGSSYVAVIASYGSVSFEREAE